jgi:hypothetical protein
MMIRGIAPRGLILAVCLLAATCLSATASSAGDHANSTGTESQRSASERPARPGCSWRTIPSPSYRPKRYDSFLRSVGVLSRDDAWAIGTAYINQEGGRERPLLLHWNGARWRLASSSGLGRFQPQAISGDAPNDVWAVGWGGNHGVIEHWDGTSWTKAAPADPGTKYWHFFGVDAVSPSNVWAVGGTATGHLGAPLIEHWNGAAWRIVSSEDVPVSPQTGLPYASLQGIDTARRSDSWAVGEATNVAPDGASNGLAERFEGSRWVAVTSPNRTAARGVPYDHLFSVAVESKTSAWAVGSFGSGSGIGGGGDHALAERWDGKKWTFSRLPKFSSRTSLESVVRTPRAGVWSVGSRGVQTRSKALILRWTGWRWTRVISHGGAGAELSAVDGAHGTLIAVGGRITANGEATLTMLCR